MHYQLRPFEPSDYPALLELHNVVFPSEPMTLEALCHEDEHRPAHCLMERWVAKVAGRLIGMGEYSQRPETHHPQRFWMDGYVHADCRRQGVGSALLHRVVSALRALHPEFALCVAQASDTDTARFLQNKGMGEHARAWVSALDLAAFDLTSFNGQLAALKDRNIEIRSYEDLAKHPLRDERLYELFCEAKEDEPTVMGVHQRLEFDHFKATRLGGPGFLPQGLFVAVQGGEFVGLSSLWQHADAGHIHIGFTGVRRTCQGQGIATALKLRGILYAKEQGCTRMFTSNHSMNAPILNINERLGFKRQSGQAVYKALF